LPFAEDQNEASEFIPRFLDLSGCSASALPPEEELQSREADALAECLDRMLLAGRSMPKPYNVHDDSVRSAMA
jgi:hypothetical protein